jgi:type II secretory pathway pseudopilin PulG
MTYIEVLVCLVIIGTSVAASMRAFGSFAIGRRIWEETAIAGELAHQLMVEINALPYSEPSGGNTIGLEGESSTDKRTFDDIDDFNNWTETPPRDHTNTVMPEFDGYSRRVSVAFTNWSPSGVSFSTGTFKKITVVVTKDGRELARLVTLRSRNNVEG